MSRAGKLSTGRPQRRAQRAQYSQVIVNGRPQADDKRDPEEVHARRVKIDPEMRIVHQQPRHGEGLEDRLVLAERLGLQCNAFAYLSP